MKMNIDSKLEGLLLEVQKPGRYIGEEFNCVKKDLDKAAVKFCLCFPDVYEVGMSYLGSRILYGVLNERKDFACERAFCPWPDFAQKLRQGRIPLYSLESRRPLAEFDIIGFSLAYEMNYTNILSMLDLSGIPLLAKERNGHHSLIIAGGPSAFNPEPLADFIDLFIIGEAEEAILEVCDVYCEQKEKRNFNKDELLLRLAQIPGVYVPKFYLVEYTPAGRIKKLFPQADEVPQKIKKRIVADLDSSFFPIRQVVPFLEIIHDRFSLEIMRGCPQACNFCQARSIYYPKRERSFANILRLAKAGLAETGWEEISLLSLSSGNHCKIEAILKALVEAYQSKGISISLPSLKIEDRIASLPQALAGMKRHGLTFAPEVASQRLQRVIQKITDFQKLEEILQEAYSRGWQRVKFYFMLGIPTESEEDIAQIITLLERFARLAQKTRKRPAQIVASISSLIPKPHTVFQWQAMEKREALQKKQRLLRDLLQQRHLPFLKLNFHHVELSICEALLSRADRRLGEVIYRAWKKGAQFDSWSDFFQFDLWSSACQEAKLDWEDFVHRNRREDEILPWQHIDAGIDQQKLWQAYQRSISS